jgi:signal transduction histidine kinase
VTPRPPELWLCAATLLLLPLAAGTQEPAPIGSAAEIRLLSEAQGLRGPRVRLQGVVVLEPTPDSRSRFCLWDGSACILIETDRALAQKAQLGLELIVEGAVCPGLFAPTVKADRVSPIGPGKIPAPVPVDLDELATGSHAQQWVSLRGVVRRVLPMQIGGTDAFRFELATGGGRLTVLMPGPNSPPPSVDAEVRVDGVCLTQFTTNRQILQPRLVMPRDSTPAVLREAPAAPPVRVLDQLMAFRPDRSNAHRAKVSGTVTYNAGGGSVWIQNEQHGLKLLLATPAPVAAGTRIEAVGFAGRDGANVVLEDAEYTEIASGPALAPKSVETPADALASPSLLLSMEGTLLFTNPVPNGLVLHLQTGASEFRVRVPFTIKNPKDIPWPVGAKLRASGICSITAAGPTKGGTGQRTAFFVGPMAPRAFELLARDAGDVAVLAPPPFWNAQHAAWSLAGTSLLLCGGLGGVAVRSRRRLREATQARRQSEAEFAAAWNERNRIARELHDTVAQELAALSLQLEVLRTHIPAESAPGSHLSQARSIVRRSLAEMRDAIWMMRSQSLEQGGLPKALQEVLERLVSQAGVASQFILEGTPRSLSPVAENNLLRIGQEAVTNALKHAAPSKIEVKLTFSPTAIHLLVRDNGSGFDSDSPIPSTSRFGVQGIRERARELNGALALTSVPGQGTELSLQIPL